MVDARQRSFYFEAQITDVKGKEVGLGDPYLGGRQSKNLKGERCCSAIKEEKKQQKK